VYGYSIRSAPYYFVRRAFLPVCLCSCLPACLVFTTATGALLALAFNFQLSCLPAARRVVMVFGCLIACYSPRLPSFKKSISVEDSVAFCDYLRDYPAGFFEIGPSGIMGASL
jgi:hypothetical protein